MPYVFVDAHQLLSDKNRALLKVISDNKPGLSVSTGGCNGCALEGSFLVRVKATLYVPGCPPHPLTFICGILDLLGIPS